MAEKNEKFGMRLHCFGSSERQRAVLDSGCVSLSHTIVYVLCCKSCSAMSRRSLFFSGFLSTKFTMQPVNLDLEEDVEKKLENRSIHSC